MVSRETGGRQWALCSHPLAMVSSSLVSDNVTRVAQEGNMFVRVDGEICIPNAPHLMSDMMGYFDFRHWMRIDV